MELYRKEKINPIGGCLPILLQIPVFLALYWVLLASVELRDSAWARLGERPCESRSLVHPAGHHDGDDVPAD